MGKIENENICTNHWLNHFHQGHDENSRNIQAACVEVFGGITQRILSNRSSSWYLKRHLDQKLWASWSCYFDSNHDKFPSFKNTKWDFKVHEMRWEQNSSNWSNLRSYFEKRFISLKKIVAFYLTKMVSTLLLISSETKN